MADRKLNGKSGIIRPRPLDGAEIIPVHAHPVHDLIFGEKYPIALYPDPVVLKTVEGLAVSHTDPDFRENSHGRAVDLARDAVHGTHSEF